MSTNPLHPSLLRPPILHILRAAGFTSTRPSVLDTLVDLASRYLTILASHTARHALLRHPSQPHQPPDTITITDVRLALQDAGALYPQLSTMEEQVRGEEDMRGIEAFISWCTGPSALEIRRIAGLAPEPSTATVDLSANAALAGKAAAETVVVERPEDFLTQLKKKHAKTRDGEESRWAGTALGREKEREGGVKIEGWEGVEELGDWAERFRRKGDGVVEVGTGVNELGAGRSESSSPLSEISAVTAT
ncbi:hypothetical protein HO173_009336 [Letharia columbiana]|uniref:Bromodomain associated domain-containing protein n=1 Tax=Letharia columbiana TaxID=112416 RepID=A0A8H6FPR0_9LECA|nr:uncharacterized protein HO173_009336 [Letharia columbiana]KAF6232457.1 hypothetical protein HO173_009336 [Letharia columbiana]